ncbi:MAG: hypothetical protein KDM64_19825, partial [Verrucomicrobiae bacterium]|nr:hypothetical protein [Verrucomicrobiae bacterium]
MRTNPAGDLPDRLDGSIGEWALQHKKRCGISRSDRSAALRSRWADSLDSLKTVKRCLEFFQNRCKAYKRKCRRELPTRDR